MARKKKESYRCSQLIGLINKGETVDKNTQHVWTMHNYDVNSPFGTNVNIRPLEPGYGFRGVPFAVIMISSCFKYILAYMVFMPNITTNHAITYTNTDTGGGGGGGGGGGIESVRIKRIEF